MASGVRRCRFDVKTSCCHSSVRMHGADAVGIDASFNVSMTAHYYAGGRAADRPVRWRVTQFPMDLASRGLPGFAYGSVNNFWQVVRFVASLLRILPPPQTSRSVGNNHRPGL